MYWNFVSELGQMGAIINDSKAARLIHVLISPICRTFRYCRDIRYLVSFLQQSSDLWRMGNWGPALTSDLLDILSQLSEGLRPVPMFCMFQALPETELEYH